MPPALLLRLTAGLEPQTWTAEWVLGTSHPVLPGNMETAVLHKLSIHKYCRPGGFIKKSVCSHFRGQEVLEHSSGIWPCPIIV